MARIRRYAGGGDCPCGCVFDSEASGPELLRCRCCHFFAAGVQFVLRRNIYETIWVVGEKVGDEARGAYSNGEVRERLG